MFELNYSKINSYLFCPYLYKFIYIDKKYTQHNDKTSLGISLHKALKEYGINKPDKNNFIEYYKENWSNYGYATAQMAAYYYEMGIDILEKFYMEDYKNQKNIIETELFFEVGLNSDYILRGTVDRIDRVDDTCVEIIDYKLGFDEHLSEKNNNDNKKNLQLMIYGYGITRSYNFNVCYVSYYYLLNLKKVRFNYVYDDKLVGFLLNVGDRMKNLVLDKKGNCLKCLAKNLCEFSKLREL